MSDTAYNGRYRVIWDSTVTNNYALHPGQNLSQSAPSLIDTTHIRAKSKVLRKLNIRLDG